MRKAKIVMVFLILSSVIWLGCGDKDPNSIEGKITHASDCLFKSEKFGEYTSDLSCIEYVLRHDTLYIKHYNTGFNCCPEGFLFTYALANDTLTLIENEEESLCDCLCLFDIEMEVYGITSGTYTLIVVEPYVYENNEKINTQINISSGDTGIYCIERNNYPWNLP